MAAAISVLPKSLLPSMGDIEEEMVDVEFIIQPYTYAICVDPHSSDNFTKGEVSVYKMSMCKDTAEVVARYLGRPNK